MRGKIAFLLKCLIPELGVTVGSCFGGGVGASPSNATATPFKGRGWSIAWVSTGLYRITFSSGLNSAAWNSILWAGVTVVTNAVNTDQTCVVKSYSTAAKTIDFECKVAGVLTDVATTAQIMFLVITAETQTGAQYQG
jgi:hypothetical protein